MSSIIMIAVGGALGAVGRYLTYLWIQKQVSHPFPFSTLIINLVGCFLLGVLLTFVERDPPLYRNLILLGATGFLGSYTTFSTFGFETLHLIRSDHFVWASVYVVVSVVVGLFAVWAGRALMSS